MAYRMAQPARGREGLTVRSRACRRSPRCSRRNKYVRDAALGNSEPILAAVVLWGFERHLDGRRDHALYLGVAGRAAAARGVAVPRALRAVAVVLRAEAPEAARRLRRHRAGAAGSCRSGGARTTRSAPARAPTRRTRAAPRSPRTRRGSSSSASRESTVAPVEAGTLVAVGVAAVAWMRRRAQGAVLALAALGFSWFALVAVMTEAGFAGNQRYLMVTTAAVSVLGGIGAVRVLQGVEAPRRAPLRQRAGRRASRGDRARRSASRSRRRRSSRRPTTPGACRAASSTRPTSGTT